MFQPKAPPAPQGPDAGQKFHCSEFVSAFGIARSSFAPTTFLRSCLMLPGKATGYGTGDTSSFFTHRPALPDPALSHTALPQPLPALPLQGPVLPWKTRPRCSGCPQGVQAELVTSLALHLSLKHCCSGLVFSCHSKDTREGWAEPECCRTGTEGLWGPEARGDLDLQGGAWRWEPEPPQRHQAEGSSDVEQRKREEKAVSFPQDGEGKRTSLSEELFGGEGSSIGSSVPVRGFVVLSHSTDQSSSLLCLQQEMKLHLRLPHLWFLLGSPRAVPHHPDPRGLLPPLKVLWHLKNNTAFTELLRGKALWRPGCA